MSMKERPSAKLLVGKKKKTPPFEFVIDYLTKLAPYTKPMFGCTGVYVGEKIVFILREKASHPKDNGVWIATTKEHHSSLKLEFPMMRSIQVFGTGVTSWQVIPSDCTEFESAVTHACDLVLKGDKRIGKIPNSKKPKPTRQMEQISRPSLPRKPKKVIRWADLQT